MMKKTAIIFTAIFFLVLNSCELYGSLDELPPNQLVEKNLFVSTAAAEATLNGVYDELLSENYFGVVTIPSIMSSNMYNRFRGVGGVGKFSSNDIDLTDMYSSFYTLIDRANNVIQGVNKMDGSLFTNNRKKEILGEAHFLRAMGHFDALRFFGHFFNINSEFGAIIRTSPVVLENKNKARATVKESYNQVISDLDFAIGNTPQKSEKFFVNRLTSKALKSKVLLYLAAANNDDKQTYQEAINLVDEVLNEGGFTLDNSYAGIFDGESPEIIFETFKPQRVVSLNRVIKLFSPNGSQYAASEAFSDFIKSDPRANFIITTTGSFQGSLITKYNDRDVLFILRATELILIKAEAYARLQNDGQARIYLNMVRESRGLSSVVNDKGEALLSLIYQEIRKDLSFENGSEWFALVRQGLETVTAASPPDIDSENFMTLPIPTREILNNPLSKQNPGYITQVATN